MPSGRFPLPWSVEEQAACFVVRDHNGQQQAGAKIGGEVAQARRGAADCQQYRKLPELLRRHNS
jgi:hypothetical protein